MKKQFWNEVQLLFPELTDKQILLAISESVMNIRSKIPLSGETTMSFSTGKWICDSCNHSESGYRTYCSNCYKQNITLP